MNNLKSILIFIPSLTYGGAEISMSRLADIFSKRGIKVYLVIAKQKSNQDIFIENKEIKIFYLNSKKTIYSFFKLKNIINDLKPDLLLSTLPTPNFMISLLKFLKLTNSRVVVREAYANYLFWNKNIFSRLNKRMAIFAFKNADGNIFISNELKRGVNKYIKNRNTTVIYNPVFTKDFFKRSEEKVADFIKKKKLWVTCSRIDEQKGLDILFDAISEIKIDYEYELLVLGKGNKLKEYKKTYNKLPIIFHGNVSNPIKYIKLADLFIFPSRAEGLGNSLIEAQILGTPIITSDCSAGPKEIVEMFSNGELFESGNKEDLKEKLLNFNYRKHNKNQPTVNLEFDVDIVGDKYLDFFDKLL